MAVPRLRRRVCCSLLAVAMATGTAAVWLLQARQGSGRASCAETLTRLMEMDGWRRDVAASSYVMQLTAEADRQAATSACVQQPQQRSAADAAPSAALGRHCFAEKLSQADRQKCMHHLDIVASELERAGIAYYLDMGTALGAHRHMDMIPYDEDVDIRIDGAQKAAARRVLMRLRTAWPGQLLFQDTEWQNQHWKVHFTDTMDPVLQRHVAMDVFFYTLNASLGRVFIREPPFSFPVGHIFPLLRRPIRSRLYPTPNSIGAMITGYFANTSLTDCVHYLHDLPFSQCRQPVVPCRLLRHRYGFAQTLQLRPTGQLQFLTGPGGVGGGSSSVTWVAFIAGAVRL